MTTRGEHDSLEKRLAALEAKVASLEGWRQWTYGLGFGVVIFFAAISKKALKLLGLDPG